MTLRLLTLYERGGWRWSVHGHERAERGATSVHVRTPLAESALVYASAAEAREAAHRVGRAICDQIEIDGLAEDRAAQSRCADPDATREERPPPPATERPLERERMRGPRAAGVTD